MQRTGLYRNDSLSDGGGGGGGDENENENENETETEIERNSYGKKLKTTGHKSQQTFDSSNINFGNYMDIFSGPVKKLLTNHLENQLTERPSLNQLQQQGIYVPFKTPPPPPYAHDPPDPTPPPPLYPPAISSSSTTATTTATTTTTTITNINTNTTAAAKQLGLPKSSNDKIYSATAPSSTRGKGKQEFTFTENTENNQVGQWFKERRHTIHDLQKKGVLAQEFLTPVVDEKTGVTIFPPIEDDQETFRKRTEEKNWLKGDLFYTHSHHTTHAVRAQRAQTFVDKDNPTSNAHSNNNDDNNYTEDNYDPYAYYNIPENIDGGIVSNWIFLPFNQWCNGNIEYHTDQADQLLTQMKQQYKSSANNENQKTTPKVDPINNQLSFIDQQLTLESDKLNRLLRIQGHVRSIQAQFDTFIDSLRQRQIEILEISKELKERHHICSETLKCLAEQETWLIQNIADTFAERAEKIDRMSKRLKQHSQQEKEQNSSQASLQSSSSIPTYTDNDERNFVEAELMQTKNFVEQLRAVILELRQISENKRQEVKALENNLGILREQNVKVGEASWNASQIAMERLSSVQNHYKLPALINGAVEIQLRADSILQAMDTYVSNAMSRDTYSRVMELWQCCAIFSDEQNKTFFNEYVSLCSQAFIDASLAREYIISNSNLNSKDKKSSLGSRLDSTRRTSVCENDLPITANVSKESEKMYELIKQSKKIDFKGLNLIMHLSEVYCREINHDAEYKKNKQIYGTEENSYITSHYLCGNCVVNTEDDRDMFNTLQAQKTELDNMLDRIIILGKYGSKIVHLETVLTCVGQYVTLQFQHDIRHRKSNKELLELANEHAIILLSTMMCTWKDPKGIMQLMNQTNSSNVYRIASQILFKVYSIADYC